MVADEKYIEEFRDVLLSEEDTHKLSDLDLAFLYGIPPVEKHLIFHKDTLGNILFAKSEMVIFGRGGIKPFRLEGLIKREDIPQYLQTL